MSRPARACWIGWLRLHGEQTWRAVAMSTGHERCLRSVRTLRGRPVRGDGSGILILRPGVNPNDAPQDAR